MSDSTGTIRPTERPQRWSVPFGQSMTEGDVSELLGLAPFASMDASRFPRTLPLRGILRNDARRVTFEDRQIILREGDYGQSAFLILRGEVEVALRPLAQETLGRKPSATLGWWTTLLSAFSAPKQPEVRRTLGGEEQDLRWREGEEYPRVFLQDFPRLIEPDGRLTLEAGEFFGELAAMSRTPRTATVVAKGECELLEIRWQGLRDLLKFDPALRAHIHQLYRDNSLRVHLRETPLLKGLSEQAIQEIAEQTVFESYGEFDWDRDYRAQEQRDIRERIESEPVIAAEGEYPDGLILIRSGFARLSRRYDDGHRTLEYLGKGRIFGWGELTHNWSHVDQLAWQYSLRALGYVDIVRIPTRVLEEHLKPRWVAGVVEGGKAPVPVGTTLADRPDVAGDSDLDSDLLEFLVEQRLLNATRALVIDLDRCTRCDDCVTACAANHQANARFSRTGPVHDRLMFAQACMHCQDPVCMIGCPTGAIGRSQETGVIAINDLTCIGCGTCASSCPYENIQMVEARDPRGNLWLDEKSQPILKATKCDYCDQQPTAPACQSACPHDALARVDLSEPSTLAQWLEGRGRRGAA